jgi:translation elongation factor aEF-1 beta
LGELIAVFRIMPQGLETDLKGLEAEARKAIPEGVKVERVEQKPIAYGLKSLNVTILMEDSESISVDSIESALSKLKGVESVQCTDVGRL